jgi:hypothetical protein
VQQQHHQPRAIARLPPLEHLLIAGRIAARSIDDSVQSIISPKMSKIFGILR